MTSLWGLVLALLMAGVFWALGPMLIDVMTKDPAVQAAARDFLPWMIAAPLLILALVMFDGIFIGATRTADMRNMMAVSAAIYFAAVWVLMEPLGNHGLWMALTVSFIARGLTLGLRYPALERAAVRAAG
jgi:MATE family multidrug resistance protein